MKTPKPPEKFDRYLNIDDGWKIPMCVPSDFDEVEFVGKDGKYYLWKTFDSVNKDCICIFRTKINPICSECGKGK